MQMLASFICSNYSVFVSILKQGDTPLLMATKRGMSDIVELLLRSGADTGVVDKVKVIEIDSLYVSCSI